METNQKFTVIDVLAGRTPVAVRDKVYITARVTVMEESHIDVKIRSLRASQAIRPAMSMCTWMVCLWKL